MRPADRLRLWFGAFVVLIFCAGLVSGVLLGRRMSQLREPDSPRWVPGQPPPAGAFVWGGARRPAMGERLGELLTLTADQRRQLEEILAASRARAATSQGEIRTRFEAEQKRLHDAIREILMPDQQRRFEEWLEQGALGRGRGRGPVPQ